MNEKSLIVKKDNIFNRIINFFRIKFFKKSNSSENIEYVEVTDKTDSIIKNEFNEENLQINKLLEFQRKLETQGINEENLKNLLKDLSFEEKEKLKNLYIDQNESLKSEIKSYKKKIMAIKA